MRRFPSYTSAIVAGALCTPILILGVDYIEKNSGNQLLQFAWFMIWFCLPVVLSTVDLAYIRKRHQEGNTLYMLIRFRAEDFGGFYIPAWKRMLAYFVSACISALFLKFIGVALG
jgi:hypothetical protein